MSFSPEVQELMAARAALADVQSKLAAVQAEARSHYTLAAEDPDIIECFRAQAWIRSDSSLQIRQNHRDGGFTGVPDGWPDWVSDSAEYIQGDLYHRFEQRWQEQAASDHATGLPEPVSPSVLKLREALGDVSE